MNQQFPLKGMHCAACSSRIEKIVGIPVAADLLFIFGGPALNPMIAGATMALSSVSVVSNALRLRFFLPPTHNFFLDLSRFRSIYIYVFTEC